MMHVKLTRFAGSHEEDTICRALPNEGVAALTAAFAGAPGKDETYFHGWNGPQFENALLSKAFGSLLASNRKQQRIPGYGF